MTNVTIVDELCFFDFYTKNALNVSHLQNIFYFQYQNARDGEHNWNNLTCIMLVERRSANKPDLYLQFVTYFVKTNFYRK